MEKTRNFFLFIFIFSGFGNCKGQKIFGVDELNSRQTVQLQGLKGRIDHLDADPKSQIVYIAALGNNSLEVVDIKNAKLLNSIEGLYEPQGVVYDPQTKEIMVANGGNGECRFYSTQTFENTATVNLGSDADDVRFDSIEQKIYVGYGDGGIAVIDARNHKKISDIKLSAHPEGFQLDRELHKLFVNVPGSGQIDVIDLANLKAEKWKAGYDANFPMAIDEAAHIIFIGNRHPAKLIAINVLTGKTISKVDLVGDIDDLYFDNRTKKIYASGGGGAINVYSFNNLELKQLANIPTRSGARTSLLISSLNTFVLAERANGGQPAQLQIFTVKH